MNLKEGIVYKTRSGKRVKVLATGLPSTHGHTCLGLIFDYQGRSWMSITFKANGGAAQFNNLPDPLDLVGYWAPVRVVK